MTETIIFEKYTFFDFSILDTCTIRFKIISNSGDFTEEDAKHLTDIIIQSLGKWENLIKTGLELFTEIGFITGEQYAIKNYQYPFGIELYETPSFAKGEPMSDYSFGFIRLTKEERHNRQNAKISPIIQIEEITNQIKNISKWRTFEKTIKNFRV